MSSMKRQRAATNTQQQPPTVPVAGNLNRGLITLPNEILWMIVLEICDPEADGYQVDYHLQLACVCRKFRDVVHYSSQLWTKIDSKRPLAYAAVQIQRSKNRGLCISNLGHCEPPRSGDQNAFIQYDRRYGCRCTTDFWRLLLPHSNRWVKVEMSDVYRHTNVSMLRNLTLPNLTSLVVEAEEIWYTPDADARVCLTWKMPKLKEIWGTHRLLDLPLDRQGGEIELGSVSISLMADIPLVSILNYFRSPAVVNVEKFALDYATLLRSDADVDMDAPEDQAIDFESTIVMKKVSAVNLGFADAMADGKDPFERVMRHLSFPGVETVKFSSHIEKPPVEEDDAMWDPLEFLQPFFDWLARPEMKNIRKVHIELHRRKDAGFDEEELDDLDDDIRDVVSGILRAKKESTHDETGRSKPLARIRLDFRKLGIW